MRKFLRLSLVCLMAMVYSSAFANIYKLEFTNDENGKFSEPGTMVFNDVAWTLSTDATHFQWDGNTNKGLQIGSKNNPASSIVLSTTAFSGNITSIKVNTSGGSGTNATLNVTVGDQTFGEPYKLTTTATEKEFTGSASGEIKLAYSISARAVYIKSIEVTYEGTIIKKKTADLKFSETDIEVEQGKEFTSPTFTKTTTANVTFTSDNEEVASVNSEGKISLGGELGTAKITAKSEENDEYYAGEATCTITVFAYNTYKKATTITSGKEYLIVAQSNNKTYYAYPLSKSDTYGYLKKGTEDGLTESIKVNSIYDDDFVFTEADGGYTIKDCYGRYMSSDDKYNTFNVGDEALIWTVEKQLDGTFKISMDNKFVQWTNSKDFGCWDTMQETAALPYLYEKYEVPTGITDVTVEKEFDENAPIYNLSGQRVDKNAKGILIQNGKKFIRR